MLIEPLTDSVLPLQRASGTAQDIPHRLEHIATVGEDNRDSEGAHSSPYHAVPGSAMDPLDTRAK